MTEQTKTLREIDTPFYTYWQALYLSFLVAVFMLM